MKAAGSFMNETHFLEQPANVPRIVTEFPAFAYGKAPLARQVDGNVLDHTSGPWAEHHHPGRKKDSFGNAVRDKHRGHFPLLRKMVQIDVELIAGKRVERTEWLVHQEQPRIKQQRPAHR